MLFMTSLVKTAFRSLPKYVASRGSRHAHWEGFGKAVASGHTTHGTGAMKTRATPKAGQKLYVSLAFAVVKDREGKVIGAMATARPFTEDKTQ